MRAAVLTVLLVASACSTTTTVRGTVLIDVGGSQPTAYEYEATESHSTTGLAVFCFLTAIYYGGACWAYLALPFDDHEARAIDNAQLDIARLGRCAVLMAPTVTGGGPGGPRRWQLRRGGALVHPLDVNKLCAPENELSQQAPLRPPSRIDRDRRDPDPVGDDADP